MSGFTKAVNSEFGFGFGTLGYTLNRFTRALLCAAAFVALGFAAMHVKETDGLFLPAMIVGGLTAVGTCLYLAHAMLSVIYGGFRRLWLGPPRVFDKETGEWHKIVGRDRYGDLIESTPHEQRRVKANVAKQPRRNGMASMLILGGFSALLLWDCYAHSTGRLHHVFGNGPYSVLGIGATLVFAGAFAVVGLTGGLFKLAHELLFQTGFQRIPNPKVLDPMPVEPAGPDDGGDDPYSAGGPARPGDLDDIYGGRQDTRPPRRFRD